MRQGCEATDHAAEGIPIHASRVSSGQANTLAKPLSCSRLYLPYRFAEDPVPKLNRWRTPLQSTSERHVHIVTGTDAHVEERLHSPGAQQVLGVAAACKRHAVTERCHLQGQPHRVEFETRGRGLRVDACRGEPVAPALGKTDCREEGAVSEVRGAS